MSKCKTCKQEIQKVYCQDCKHWGAEWLKHAEAWISKGICNHPLNLHFVDSHYAVTKEQISCAQDRNAKNNCPDFQAKTILVYYRPKKKWWQRNR